MPRIDAPTVAEHRANQERALLDAARTVLLQNGPQAVSPATVGAAAGLARSSVYKYFRSGDEILFRIVGDALVEWAERVRDTVERAETPAGQIEAYVRTTLALAASGAHRVAVLGSTLPRDEATRRDLADAQHDSAAPLRAALAALGNPNPDLTAELIDGALGRAIARIDAGCHHDEIAPETVAFVRRALSVDHRPNRRRGKG
ncbi:TetR family transcriptional regulator [Nocardia tenerifensis]|uniref:TetR family transcriptional regulator n=2 Tax=Nocardia tenerifensis TaxID=228006 RepID=A0A318K162_9NOCA|nr:TetR/AcrR family transcriptional regulator [Nocardia tenerifensis]PXX64147.1 TetR family transcriptional regulator [Nocardia tenerifensis]